MNDIKQQYLKDLDKKLWAAADKLLSNVNASEYKDVVVWLVFLKYVCDTFDFRSEFLTLKTIQKFNIKVIPAKSILLSFKLTVGRVAISGVPLATNEAIAHFVSEDVWVVNYIYYYLLNFDFKSLGSTSSIATAINSKMVKSIPVIVPPDHIVKKFHSFVSPLMSQIECNQKSNKILSNMRDTLLTKLMSGEIIKEQ